MMNNKVLVEREQRSPMTILTEIKMRATDNDEEKIRLQKQLNQLVKTHNDHYFIWLEENRIDDFKFEALLPRISFIFANVEDAMAFKLRWT